MHRDCAVQTMPAGLTLIIDDDVRVHDDAAHDDDAAAAEWTSPAKGKGVRRHFAQYGDQQAVSDDLALGWDCGICFETAEEPCVTRCGHLYCQAHLHHWLAAHPSCPVCKAFCTPAADVVPIFSRGRASTPSSTTSSSAPPSPLRLFLPSPPSSPPPPSPPPDTFSLSGARAHRPAPTYSAPEFPLHTPSPAPAPASPHSTSAPLSPLHAPPPHPLLTAHVLAHRVGLALRVLGLAILLGVLLR